MQGVQILNEFMHEGAVAMPWCVIGIGCCFVGSMGIVFLSVLRGKNGTCIFIFLLALFALFAFSCGIGVLAPRELTPRYQVIVEDDVNFNEFLDKYKIIEQNGSIYTVEERE